MPAAGGNTCCSHGAPCQQQVATRVAHMVHHASRSMLATDKACWRQQEHAGNSKKKHAGNSRSMLAAAGAC
eukprot:357818-Chlamydomonas_euryale.AAC.4